MMTTMAMTILCGNFSYPLLFSFFKTIDWEGVRSKELKPPIVPKFGFSGDTRNFEEYAETDWINVPEASAKEERLFRDF